MPRADDRSLFERSGRYECPYCNAKFEKSEHVKRHIRSHTKEKPFACHVCEKGFSRVFGSLPGTNASRGSPLRSGRDSLRRHAKTHVLDGQSERPQDDAVESPTSGDTSRLVGTMLQIDDEAVPVESASLAAAPMASPVRVPLEAINDPGRSPGPVSIARTEVLPASSTSRFPTLAEWARERPGMLANTPHTTHSEPMAIPSPILAPPEIPVLPDHFNASLMFCGGDAALPSAVENGGLFGDELDPETSAYFESLFGEVTQGIFSRVQSPEPSEADAPLLPLSSWRANLVSNGWKLRATSGKKVNMEATGAQMPIYAPQSAESLAWELKMPAADDSDLQQTIPSLNFVDLALGQYFARFHSSFPILHRPTFSRATANPLLLLSVISLGAIFISTPNARVRAYTIFKRLQELTILTWIKHVQKSTAAAVVVAQLACLCVTHVHRRWSRSSVKQKHRGQSFALLHSDTSTFLVFQSFHATVVRWARWAELLNTGSEQNLLESVLHKEPAELDRAWRAWIDREKARRVVQGLVIHENELSARTHSAATAWHTHLPGPCSDALFEAPTAGAWREVLVAEAAHPTPALSSFFQLSVGLAELRIEHAALSALPDLGLRPAAMAQFAFRLEQMQQSTEQLASDETTPPRGLAASALSLLHGTALSLYADPDLVEQCCGREGLVSQANANELVSWASSEDGRRSAVHAARCLYSASALGGLLHEGGLHMLRVSFQAALALFAFIAVCPLDSEDGPIDLVSCDIETFSLEGCGRRVTIAGIMESGGNRRLDAMALLHSSAQMCSRMSAFGIATAYQTNLTIIAEQGI